MDFRDRIAEVWGDFLKRLKRMPTRNEGKGKHRKGHQSKTTKDARVRLLASRKRERQARRYARLCANSQKHRA